MPDYVSLYLNYPHPQSLLLLFLLCLMRLFPILTFVPFFGAKIIPPMAKVGLGICLATIFVPHLIFLTKTPLQFDLSFLGYCLKEIFIGISLAFIVSAPFWMAQSSGVIIDQQRGASSITGTDPTLGEQSSPLGQLYNYVMIILFIMGNGPMLFIDAVMKSYEVVPPDQFFSSKFFFDTTTPFYLTILGMMNTVMTMAIQLAAPSLVAILMSNMFLGIANRLAPQVPMSFLGTALNSILGLGLLWAAWFFILQQLNKEAFSWLDMINNLIPTLHQA